MKLSALINPNSSITVFLPGIGPKVVSVSHRNFAELLVELKKPSHNVVRITELSNLEDYVRSFAIKAVGAERVKVEHGEITYCGHVLGGYLVDKILEFLSLGLDAQPLVNFLERLMKNPSKRAVDELYKFLEHGGFPICEDGCFLGYRGVRNDYYSKTGNKETIVLQGKVDADGHIYNGVGETIEIQRASVDEDKNIGCSFGAHVGEFSYAQSWGGGGRLLVVKVDPADAVSVPLDSSCQKLRCCKYVVVEEITDKPEKLTDTVSSKHGKVLKVPKRDSRGRFAPKSRS